MLRDAVRENVEEIDGKVRPRRRFGRSRPGIYARVAAVIVIPLAVFVSINAISGSASRQEVLVVQRPPGATAVPADASRSTPHAISPSVFHLSVTRVAVDAGHGGTDPGTSGFGLTEKDVTLDVARRLAVMLEESGLEPVLTRAEDRYLSLRERAQAANGAKADLFVSVHVNSIPRPERRGVETYCLGPSDDPLVHELAGAENRESGYSLSDFRRLLEGVFAGVRQNESRRLAEEVQSALFDVSRRSDPSLSDRGVKGAPFVVLVATEMPGVLAEVSCLSNEEDARRLSSPAYRNEIAAAIFRGVSGYVDAGLLAPARGRGGAGKGTE